MLLTELQGTLLLAVFGSVIAPGDLPWNRYEGVSHLKFTTIVMLHRQAKVSHVLRTDRKGGNQYSSTAPIFFGSSRSQHTMENIRCLHLAVCSSSSDDIRALVVGAEQVNLPLLRRRARLCLPVAPSAGWHTWRRWCNGLTSAPDVRGEILKYFWQLVWCTLLNVPLDSLALAYKDDDHYLAPPLGPHRMLATILSTRSVVWAAGWISGGLGSEVSPLTLRSSTTIRGAERVLYFRALDRLALRACSCWYYNKRYFAILLVDNSLAD